MSNFGSGDDLGHISRRPYRSSGLDRQQRLNITLAVSALVLLLLGTGIGFAIGRATAPEPPAEKVTQPAATTTSTPLPSGVVEEVPTETAEADTTSEEPAEEEAPDEEPPPTPKQRSPKDGAVINASRVYLRWTSVEDDSGDPVTYAFEIQDRLSDGSYGKTQVISGLESTSYSARVLYVRRRWRVWAVDKSDNRSDKTGWRYYRHKPKPEPEPSDDTT